MNKRDDEPKNVVSELLKSRLSRVPAANSGGLQAMSIGLVLGGCVAFGYFVGAWLDGKFKTSFCMPIGVFLGLAAGFREMFVTLKHLSAQTKWPSATSHLNSPKDNAANTEISRNRVLDSRNDAAETSLKDLESEEERVRPRIFKVPAPPTSRYDVAPSSDELQSAKKNDLESRAESLETDTENLTRKLLTPESDASTDA